MTKPIVGVLPLWDDEKESLWMLPGYFDGVITNGGIPIMLPMTDDKYIIEKIVEKCDGFLFTGGHDVSPYIYGEEPLEGLVSSNRKRDEMELILLGKAIESDKPVLGICRGIQFINAALGGTLYQDIPKQYPSGVEHHQKPPYNRYIHTVTVNVDSPLHKCLNTDIIHVNSYHHQAVKRIAADLKVMATSEDGLTEAVYMPGQKFLWGIQWHPEFMYSTDDNSKKIFKAFIDAMIN
jgi:putative glutamine amidotransferase